MLDQREEVRVTVERERREGVCRELRWRASEAEESTVVLEGTVEGWSESDWLEGEVAAVMEGGGLLVGGVEGMAKTEASGVRAKVCTEGDGRERAQDRGLYSC